jgi:DNA helicase HerA-like ATPase
MNDERKIGRIIFVDSFRVMTEIDKDIKSLTKSFYTGVHPVAQINSYIVIPVGSQEIVAIVTKVTMTEETKEISTKTSITLPESKRLLYATMIGRIENGEYYQGITSFPSLSNPVWSISPKELDIIFDKMGSFRKDENKSYYISVGESASFPGYEIKIDPDALFSKHLAILGNTGSGKSCTIASLIQAILFYEDEKVKNAHFVILDTNGEYKRAFEGKNGKKIGDYLYIGSDNLKIPYWFMNSEDFITLFKASEKSQAPVLNDAILYARNKERRNVGGSLLENLINVVEDAKKYYKNSLKYKDNDPNRTFDYVMKEAKEPKSDTIQKAVKDFVINKEGIPIEDFDLPIDADAPHYFDFQKLIPEYLEDAMKVGAKTDNRVREYCNLMLLRMRRYFKDPRFKFLFEKFPEHPNSLSTFLRFIMGRMGKSFYGKDDKLSENELLYLKEYFEECQEGQNHQVVIIDLNLLASEILENITALLGRLILEFLQRAAKYNKNLRGKFPVVLVLEEAHNYIPEKTKGDNESVSKIVFERIAREGRKFGLSLVVASQRPSELSRTVLAQCNSFIVHRIQNPEDQEYIRKIVPSINEDILRQLPALAQQTALIFGDCVRSPALLKIRQAEPYPRGDDPKFFVHWIEEQKPEEPPFEEICKKWEKD